MKRDRRDFLLEINVEELPAGYVRPALNSLQQGFLEEFKTLGVAHGEVYTAGTATKLVCYIKDILEQPDADVQDIIGPSKKIALDENGNWTKQALGFAKARGVNVKDLKIKPTEKGEYSYFKSKRGFIPIKDRLQAIVPDVIRKTHFPKTMRWDDSGLRFARPIESVFALFGNETIDVRIDNIPQKKIKPIYPAKYLEGLGKWIDCEKRKEEIRRLILAAEEKSEADQYVDENLLDEINFMVNSPNAFVGGFNKKFLALPQDVLKASMAKHQRVFPVSKNGRLINKFIAIVDGKKRKNNKVRKNYENVLEAKLKDSLFFLDEDTKKPLSENIPQLKDLIFHKDLGSMFEKIERLKELCGFICDKSGEGSLKIDCMRAAELSKADLVMHMVGEFPSLQGVMGGEYALRSKEKKEVAQAIKEHYLPQGADDDLPKTKAGAILAVSDKIDNVVGLSGIGVDIEKIKISGSLDPFGTRRNAFGIIRIIRNKSFRLNLDELIEKGIELYGAKIKRDTVKFKNQIINYVKDRIDFLMGDIKPQELKKAVLQSGPFDIANIFKRQESLAEIKKETYFLEAAKVVERTSNILKGAKKEKIGDVDEKLFKEDLERAVWKAYLDSKDKIQGLIEKEEYKKATREYAQVFYKILHDFFDKVLVNTEEKAVRLNRLAMMKAINKLYTERIADLARLPQIVVR